MNLEAPNWHAFGIDEWFLIRAEYRPRVEGGKGRGALILETYPYYSIWDSTIRIATTNACAWRISKSARNKSELPTLPNDN
jgi:hypothetical protein